MSTTFPVTDDISVEVHGSTEAGLPPFVYICSDGSAPQVVCVFADEIKALIAALRKAQVWFAWLDE